MNTSLIFRKSEFRLFLLLALTGLILRGLYLFEYAHFANFDLAIGADVGEYHTRAQEILRGIFFPAVPDIHAPLYSFFIAGLQKIGLSLPGIRIFQTLLNYFSWISLFFLLRKKGFPEKCAFAFLGLSMILAPLIFHPAELISEALLLPLLTAVFFFIDSAENTSFRQKAVFSSSAGIFSALALLTHGMLSGFLLLETLYLFFRKKWLIGAFFAGGYSWSFSPLSQSRAAITADYQAYKPIPDSIFFSVITQKQTDYVICVRDICGEKLIPQHICKPAPAT